MFIDSFNIAIHFQTKAIGNERARYETSGLKIRTFKTFYAASDIRAVSFPDFILSCAGIGCRLPALSTKTFLGQMDKPTAFSISGYTHIFHLCVAAGANHQINNQQ